MKARRISLNTLHLLAFLLLLLDAFAFLFPSIRYSSPNGETIAFSFSAIFGALAIPILVYLMVEIYFLYDNWKRFALLLLLFAATYEIPFNLLIAGSPSFFRINNIFFALLIGLMSVRLLSANLNGPVKLLGMIFLFIVSCITNCNLGAGILLLTLLFYFTRALPYRRLLWIFGMLLIIRIVLKLTERGISSALLPDYLPVAGNHYINSLYLSVLSIIPISLSEPVYEGNYQKIFCFLYFSLPFIYLGIYAIRYCVKGF